MLVAFVLEAKERSKIEVRELFANIRTDNKLHPVRGSNRAVLRATGDEPSGRDAGPDVKFELIALERTPGSHFAGESCRVDIDE